MPNEHVFAWLRFRYEMIDASAHVRAWVKYHLLKEIREAQTPRDRWLMAMVAAAR